MIHPHDDADRRFDQNLRTLGPMIELPGAPAPAERARWTSDRLDAWCAAPRRPILKGIRTMLSNHRALKIGSAVAAAVTLFVLFNFPSQQTRVEAATIFNSLRTTAWSGLHVLLDNVDVDGIAVGGSVRVRFAEQLTLARLVDKNDSDSNPGIEGVLIDLKVRAGPGADADVIGLDVAVRGGIATGNGWVFLQLAQLPDEVREEVPGIEAILGFFRYGMLIDLPPELCNFFDGFVAGPASIPAINPKTGAAMQVQINAADVDAAGSVAAHVDSQGGVAAGIDIDLNDSDLEGVIRGLLSGTATPEQFEMLATKLEEQARNVTITDAGNGVYILRASGLKLDDADDEKMLKHAEIEVGYRDGAGVEWVSILHFGSKDGTIRVAFSDEGFDVSAARQEMIDQGVQVVDLEKLAGMFGQLHVKP